MSMPTCITIMLVVRTNAEYIVSLLICKSEMEPNGYAMFRTIYPILVSISLLYPEKGYPTAEAPSS